MSDKSAKMLERVRALLAKAASTDSAPEADACREKADAIMTEYAIEQWQVDQAQSGVNERRKPERQDFDFSWYRNNPFKSELWSLMIDVATHCRCQAIGAKVDWGPLVIPVIGYKSDLQWFDLLFTNLMIAMMQKVDPQPKSDLTLNENLALMREAGMPWEDAINRIIKLGTLADVEVEEGVTFQDVYKPWVHGYRAWCRKTGHSQSYVNQNTFRRNFAMGFAAEVGDRLYRMRRESERAYNETHEAGSMALAVQDIRAQIYSFIYDEWPDLKPHARDCMCAECKRRRRQPVRRGTTPRSRIDEAGIAAGRAAGAKVNLQNNPGDRIGSRRQIGD